MLQRHSSYGEGIVRMEDLNSKQEIIDQMCTQTEDIRLMAVELINTWLEIRGVNKESWWKLQYSDISGDGEIARQLLGRDELINILYK